MMMPTKHHPARTRATPVKKVAVPNSLSWVAKKDMVRTGPFIVDAPVKNKICEGRRVSVHQWYFSLIGPNNVFHAFCWLIGYINTIGEIRAGIC